jgi:hypothetical protein
MIWKVTHQTAGGHVHCSLFSAPRAGSTFAKYGDFCVRVDEFDQLRIAMRGVTFEERKP